MSSQSIGSSSVVRATLNSIFMQQSRLVSRSAMSSCVAIPHCVGMSVYSVSLLVWVALLQGVFSQTEKHMHGEKVVINSNQNQTSREGRALSVGVHRAVAGAPYLREMGRMT